jgi:hypothetical protein
MTNVMLIAIEEARLIQEGKMREDEELHTFKKWQSLGYSIKKGEKAVAKFPIWKHTVKATEEGDEEAHMFMKMSCFFSTSQVERRTA